MTAFLRDWTSRLLGGGPPLPEDLRQRLAAWQALPRPGLDGPLSRQQWLVVDVETTGLDIRADELLAIGAVAVSGSAIPLAASFDAVLRRPNVSSHDNILIHRIAGDEQRGGHDPAEALLAFLRFAGKRPIVGFHADFDRAMIVKATRKHLGIGFDTPFLDLALVAPALHAGSDRQPDNLDGWLRRYGIVIAQRHRAVFDALGTAQFLQVLVDIARAQGIERASQLFALAGDQAWLNRSQRH